MMWPCLSFKIAIFCVCLTFIQGYQLQKTLPKCCEKDQVLFRNRTLMTCGSLSSINTEFHSVKRGLSFQFANCKVIAIDDVSRNVFIYNAHCIDMLHNTETKSNALIAVTCTSYDENEFNPSLLRIANAEIVHTRTCCKAKEYFDYKLRICKKLSSTTYNTSYNDVLQHFYGKVNYLMNEVGTPECSGGYLIDYKLSSDKLIIKNSRVSIYLPNYGMRPVEVNVDRDNMCIHTSHSGKLVARVCSDPMICENHLCLKKCCRFGEKLNFPACEPMPTYAANKTFHRSIIKSDNPGLAGFRTTITRNPDYGVKIDMKCDRIRSYMKTGSWFLTSHGKVQLRTSSLPIKHNSYCMDLVEDENKEFDFALVICGKFADNSWSTLMRLLLVVSCICIAITILIYQLIPALYYHHEACATCLLSFHFIGLCLLCFGTTGWVPVGPYCKYWGYISHFFLLYGFSWLTVMFYDSWQGIKGMRSIHKVNKIAEHPTTLYTYCLFAWCIACAVVLLTILCENVEEMRPAFRPYISSNSCWFHVGENYGLLLYFGLPILLQTLVNIVFIILTSIDCYYINIQINTALKDSKKTKRKNFNERRDQFILNIKLLLVIAFPVFLNVTSDVLIQFYNSSTWAYNVLFCSEFLDSTQGFLFLIIFITNSNFRQEIRTLYNESQNCVSKTNKVNGKGTSDNRVVPVAV